MQPVAILQVLVLTALANGAPVIAKKLIDSNWAAPLDFGLRLADGHPLFGPSKTIRGIVVAVLAAAAGAPAMGLDWRLGAAAGAAAMAGDLLSSFVKRRLNRPSSSRALGIDQIPESLLPFLVCRSALSLDALDIVIGVALFFVGEVILSRLLYKAHVRDEPY